MTVFLNGKFDDLCTKRTSLVSLQRVRGFDYGEDSRKVEEREVD
jgi:hypothetical protein